MSFQPRRRLPPLHALRAFEAAARHSSFKRAADELAVTPTAVSHHIRALEDMLGVPLFRRTSKGVVLTPEGSGLFPHLRDSFDAMDEAVARLRQPRRRPVLTLSVTVAFAARWLLPRIAELQRELPAVDLRIHASDRPANLSHGEADVAIRYGGADDPELCAELLFQDAFAPVCSPSLGLTQAAGLSEHTVIRFEWRTRRRNTPTWEKWFRAANLGALQPGAELIFTDESQAIQAAVAGQGVALASTVLVTDEIHSGRLVQPFGPTLEGFAYRLVHVPEHPQAGCIATLREWFGRLESA